MTSSIPASTSTARITLSAMPSAPASLSAGSTSNTCSLTWMRTRTASWGSSQKAATAAEHFMLARYFMHKVVYFHKTIFAFETLLRQILFLLRREGLLWADGKAIKNIVADDEQFSSFHDGFIDGLIAQQVARSDTLGLLCRCLHLRRCPVLLQEYRTLERRDGPRSEDVIRFQTRRKDRLATLAGQHGIPIECFLWEDPKDVSLEKVGPFVGIASQCARRKPRSCFGSWTPKARAGR